MVLLKMLKRAGQLILIPVIVKAMEDAGLNLNKA